MKDRKGRIKNLWVWGIFTKHCTCDNKNQHQTKKTVSHVTACYNSESKRLTDLLRDVK
jgi:hypothetical protein